MYSNHLIPAILLASVARVFAQSCSLLGPAYPPSLDLGASCAIRRANDDYTQLLRNTLKTGQTDHGPFDNENTTFSIGVFSAGSHELLYEFHHQATGSFQPAVKPALNGNSVYRIGSVAKTLTILTMISKLGDVPWQDPVTKYIPELATASTGDVVDNVQWFKVTLGALASHLSGVAHALLDNSGDPNSPLPKLGFPNLEDKERVPCGTFGLKPCTREESLKLLLARHPIAAVFETPVYSNTAYGLLGLVLEKMTGESFEDIFNSEVVNSLNLTRTFWRRPPNDSNVVIPGDRASSWWDYDLAQDTPAGNTYQSIRDLSSVGRAILNSTLLPPSTTKAWLKPASHTANLYGSIGMPWEIVRLDLPIINLSDQKRTVDLYTKAGGIGAYGAVLALSPDHGIGFAILAAGPSPGFPGQIPVLTELALDSWIPAAEAASRLAAGIRFAGSYLTHLIANSTGPEYSVAVALDQHKPGLIVANFSVSGINILPLLGVESIQLFPVGLEEQVAGLSSPAGRVAFRGVLQQSNVVPLPQPKRAPQYLRPCSTTWLEVDTFRYGGMAIDEFVFEVGEDGKAIALEIPVLRTAALQRKM
ncbi:beta-lactamase/transpeptidase-like protein [Thozetella sp. PMI_491]|nr:beta-lactamase/transpeptidase-like protein [Thozetella sp. PMI_491]